jgi:DNA repair protein RadC
MLTIRDLPEGERPRERQVREGVGVLSNIELLVAVLGSADMDEAADVLKRAGGLLGLGRLSDAEIRALLGGSARANALVRALELGRRVTFALQNEDLLGRMQINSADAVARFASGLIGSDTQENLLVIFLDTKNRVIGHEIVYRGTINQVSIRAAEVLRPALAANAAALIVAHNHPSGDVTPSPDDRTTMDALYKAAVLLDVNMLDALIVGPCAGRYTSFAQQGWSPAVR